MTIGIRVKLFYNGNDGDDYLGLMRIGDRINELKRVLAYSTKPYSIQKDYIYDSIGRIEGEEFVFYVDDVYEKMVKNVIDTLDECNMSWRERFRKNHKVVCA